MAVPNLPFNLTSVATELGKSFPLSLTDADVIALAGASGLPYNLSQLAGKSAISASIYTIGSWSMTSYGGPPDYTEEWSATASVAVYGGTPTGYSWFVSSGEGYIDGSWTGATVNLKYYYPGYGSYNMPTELGCNISHTYGTLSVYGWVS